MPEVPARRPSPFLFLMLASPILKLAAACWLAFGIVGLWTATRIARDAGAVGKAYWFTLGGQATWLLVQTILLLAAGDLCIALIDMHRDLSISRERLERMGSAPSGSAAPPPAPRV